MAFTASSAAVLPSVGSYFRSISRTTMATSLALHDRNRPPGGLHGCTAVLSDRLPGEDENRLGPHGPSWRDISPSQEFLPAAGTSLRGQPAARATARTPDMRPDPPIGWPAGLLTLSRGGQAPGARAPGRAVRPDPARPRQWASPPLTLIDLHGPPPWECPCGSCERNRDQCSCSYLNESSSLVRKVIPPLSSRWMSCLTTSATRRSWRTSPAVFTACAAASSYEVVLVPMTSITL